MSILRILPAVSRASAIWQDVVCPVCKHAHVGSDVCAAFSDSGSSGCRCTNKSHLSQDSCGSTEGRADEHKTDGQGEDKGRPKRANDSGVAVRLADEDCDSRQVPQQLPNPKYYQLQVPSSGYQAPPAGIGTPHAWTIEDGERSQSDQSGKCGEGYRLKPELASPLRSNIPPDEQAVNIPAQAGTEDPGQTVRSGEPSAKLRDPYAVMLDYLGALAFIRGYTSSRLKNDDLDSYHRQTLETVLEKINEVLPEGKKAKGAA